MDRLEDYEATRQRNIEHNHAIIQQLGLAALPKAAPARKPKRKQVVIAASAPNRASSRIARLRERHSLATASPRKDGQKFEKTRRAPNDAGPNSSSKVSTPSAPTDDVDAIVHRWSSWTPAAPEPTRDDEGTLHFLQCPDFLPNKSPIEILHEGAFGGSYFRPLFSKRLGVQVSHDWDELPKDWLSGLDVARYVANTEYDASVNKYGVSCGQSIEEWEANGWIAHEFDVRGWFQWYCRFFLGRRCEDDSWQVGRWSRCVGQRGRWRRVLLKQYVRNGIRSVMDEEGGEGGSGGEVSPVVSQTCFHWAWEVRQADLDAAWEEWGR